MNVLVTGATGFIGSHICNELVQKQHNVIGLSRSGALDRVKQLLNDSLFQLKVGNIQDMEFLCHLIQNNDIDFVIHLAAQLPQEEYINEPFGYIDTNATGSLNLLFACHHSNVDKFIYGSSMSVYSDPPIYLPVNETHPTRPLTPYGVSKLVGELYCNLFKKKMKTIVLRYGGVYGRGQPKRNAIPTFIDQALSNKPITIFGDGKQTSDYTYVKDVVKGTLLAMNSEKSAIYNLGSGRETSVIELAEQIILATHSKSRITISNRDTNRPFRFVLDIGKIKRELGYYSQPFNNGLLMYLSDLGYNSL